MPDPVLIIRVKVKGANAILDDPQEAAEDYLDQEGYRYPEKFEYLHAEWFDPSRWG